MVATQVVRRVAFQLGSFEDTRAIAFASAGSLTIAFIAAATSALFFVADLRHAAEVGAACVGELRGNS
jgi:hypothetical protein